MNEALIIDTLMTGFGLLLLWILIFWLVPDYRVDAVRQKLFSIRDSLFDEAAAGKISFDDPSYRMLREQINNFIRVAHKLNLPFVAAAMLHPELRRGTPESGYSRILNESIANLSGEPRAVIESANREVDYVMLNYVFWGLVKKPRRKSHRRNESANKLGRRQTRIISVIKSEARSIDLMERDSGTISANV